MSEGKQFVNVPALQASIVTTAARPRPDDALRRPSIMGGSVINGGIAGSGVQIDPRYRTVCGGQTHETFGLSTYGSGKKFTGFPSMEIDDDQTMHILTASSATHGNATCAVGRNISTDLGNSWSMAVSPFQATGEAATQIADIYRIRYGQYAGRYLLAYWNPNDNPLYSKIVYSTDRMVTWSSSVSAYDPGAEFTRWICSQIMECSDGTLLMFGYGYKTSTSTDYISSCMKSTDGGATWTRQAIIYDGDTANEQPEEPCCIQLASGRLLCFIRNDNTSSGVVVDRTIRIFYSDNVGATWAAYSGFGAQPGCFPGWGRPDAYVFESGTICVITRGVVNTDIGATYVGAPVIYTSYDDGVTWTEPQLVHGRTGYMAYARFKRAGRNLAALCYGVSPAEDGTQLGGNNPEYYSAQTYFTYVSDGIADTPFRSKVGGVIKQAEFVDRDGNFVVPPRSATGTVSDVVLALIKAGVFTKSPLDCAGISGLWEADTIANTNNDLTGLISGTSTALTRISGQSVSGTTDGGATWSATSGVMTHSAASGNNMFYWTAGQLTGTFTATTTWKNNGQVGLVFKRVDGSNYLYLGADSSAIKLYIATTANGGSPVFITGTTGSGVLVDSVAATFTVTISSVFNSTTGFSEYTITVLLNGAACLTYVLNSTENAAVGAGAGFGIKTASTTASFTNITWHKDLYNGDLIGYLNDQGSNSLAMTQASTSLQPSYQVDFDLFAGKPHLRFDGGALKQLLTPTFASQSQPNAMMLVGYIGAASGAYANILNGNADSGNTQNLGVSTAGRLSVNAGTGGGGASQNLNPTTNGFPLGPFVLTGYFNAASSIVRYNGRTVFRATNATKLGTSAITQLSLGDASNAATFNAAAVALLAHGTPVISELIDLEQHFARKYAIPLWR